MTHMSSTVGVRELRQNLSKYLERVKQGESLIVTERGTEVARITPSGAQHGVLARLIARGATIPQGDLLENLGPPQPAPDGLTTAEVLDEQRADRL